VLPAMGGRFERLRRHAGLGPLVGISTFVLPGSLSQPWPTSSPDCAFTQGPTTFGPRESFWGSRSTAPWAASERRWARFGRHRLASLACRVLWAQEGPCHGQVGTAASNSSRAPGAAIDRATRKSEGGARLRLDGETTPRAWR